MDGKEACKKILEHFISVQENLKELSEESTLMFPNVYALTSDLDKRLKAQLESIGFKNVYQELTDDSLRLILTDSNLVFNEQANSSIDSQYDEERGSSCSNSSNEQDDNDELELDEEDEESEDEESQEEEMEE